MATRDFTANQIRTAKVIMTGSAAQGGIGHKNLELSVYSESVAPNELGGTPSPSPYSQVGDDASIFISGSQTARGGSDGGLTLFHGDTYISGALVVENAGRSSHGASISGSIHHTATGDSYLKAGTGIAISSGSAFGGQVTITSIAEQNVFTTIDIDNSDTGYTWGTSNIESDQASDTLSFIAGENITLESDADQDAIKISATDFSLDYYDESNITNMAAPLASGDYAVAIGTGALSKGMISYTFGTYVTASGPADVSIGYGNSTHVGSYTGEGSNGNIIAGGLGNIVSSSHNSGIFGGRFNTISGSTASGILSRNNLIAGGYDNIIKGFETQSMNWGTIVGSNESALQPAISGEFQGIYSSDRSKITKGDKSLILGGEENLINTSKPGSAATGYNTLIGTHLTSSGYANVILGFGSGFSDYQSGNDAVIVSGSYFKSDGLNGGAISGSITRTSEDKSYLVAGSNMTITSASNGQITLSSTGGGGTSFSQYYSLEGPLLIPSASVSGESSNGAWGAELHRALTSPQPSPTDPDVSNASHGFTSKGGRLTFDHSTADGTRPNAVFFRTSIPSDSVTTITISIDIEHAIKSTGVFPTGTNTGDFKIIFAGRVVRFDAGQGPSNQKSDGPSSAGNWLGTTEGNYGDGWNDFGTYTVTGTSGPYTARMTSPVTNIDDIVNTSDAGLWGEGDMLDICIARNRGATQIGSSADDTLATALFVYGIRVEFN